MTNREQAFINLGIPDSNKCILSLDGGGIRGILTVQLLKKLEEIAGIPCFDLFDMVSGTSTGGIIAGLIAKGKSANEIENLYISLVKKVFVSRNMFSNRFFNPPEYTKKNYRKLLSQHLGKETTLQDACSATDIDLLITSKDVAAGEETFFSCFKNKQGKWIGTYKDVLLRATLEATMSAPTYFSPLERFVDGGVTTYNNPVLATIMEAAKYGPKGKYSLNKMTVFSFGTGCRPQFVNLDKIEDPDGVDAMFWLQWIMDEAGDDASDMQNYLLHSGFIPNLDFRRYQISLNVESMQKLENRRLEEIDEVEADWLHELTNEELSGIALDKVSHFPLMKIIGEAMVDYIRTNQNPPFSKSLVDGKGKELLVSRRGDVTRIKKQMSDEDWLDSNNFE